MNKTASKKILVDFAKAKKGVWYDDHYTLVTTEGTTIGFEAKVVDELPQTGEEGYIYLVPKQDGSGEDTYDEWVWALKEDNTYGWEHIGSTAVNIEVDDELSDTSENPVQNKVIKGALDEKVNTSDLPAIPTVAQTTGTSTTDVMSQASTSQMIYPSGYETTKTRIAIGDKAKAGSDGSIVIGANAQGSEQSSADVVIGTQANFMCYVNEMISTITVKAPSSVFKQSPDKYSLTASSQSHPAYATGIKLTGTYANGWKNYLPDRSVSGPYRKLIVV